MRSNLTLNLGLRYERTTMPLGFLGTTDPAVRAVGVPGPAQNDNNNWAPRIGFAYQPVSKTVIRGAYGIFFLPTSQRGYGVTTNAGFQVPW